MGVQRVLVLGPVAAEVDGQQVDVGGAQQRALLGALAAARGRPVPVARLAEELWGPDEPASAKTLSVYVSRLRRAVGDVVHRDAGGYRLDDRVAVDADEAAAALDLARTHARSGGHEQAVRTLDQALSAWRGETYAGLSGPIAVAERTRLEQLRLSLLEERAAALLALGRHHDVVLALLSEQRTTDRLAVQLAVALHQSGRPLEALEAVRARRDDLLDSGLDPSAELTALEHDLLARAAHLEAPRRSVPASPAPASPRRRRTASAPVPLSPLLGRDGLLGQACAALAASRLVTLVGAGGVGKTRAAVELARAAGGTTAWVALAEVRDAQLLAVTVAAALEVTTTDGPGAVDAVAAALGDEQVLLVVDNCEHLDAVGPLVARLLSACPGLRVLATSRAPLEVPGEVAVRVPPLPLRMPDGADGPAVALFLDRSGASDGRWSPDEDDLREVRRICAALDGLPLAVELAAARCPALSPADIALELQDRFALLTSRGVLLAHHRSLHAAIDWSYQLLGTPEQRALRALAAFDGGFELDAATQLLDGPAARPVAELVLRSLLEVDLTVRPRRYRMLESVREFAAGAGPPAERADVERRHVRWVTSLVAAGAAGLVDGVTGPGWMARLTAERANVRVAVLRALAHGDVPAALQVVGALGAYWYRRGLVQEGLSLLDAALAAPGGDAAGRARALDAQAHLRHLAGDRRGALASAEQAYALRDRTDARTAGRLEATLGWVLTANGRTDRALAHVLRARAGAPDGPEAAEAALAVAVRALAAGDADAERLALAAAEQARAVGHEWAAGTATWIAATGALSGGRLRLAAARACAVVEHGERGTDPVLVLRGALLLAGALAGLGEAAAGARLLGAVTATATLTGLRVEPSPGVVDDVAARLRSQLGAARVAHEVDAGTTWDLVHVVHVVRSLATSLGLREEPCACAAAQGVVLLMPTRRPAVQVSPTG